MSGPPLLGASDIAAIHCSNSFKLRQMGWAMVWGGLKIDTPNQDCENPEKENYLQPRIIQTNTKYYKQLIQS